MTQDRLDMKVQIAEMYYRQNMSATGNREGCEYVANHGFAYSETLH